jgi:hypothetical protein
MGIEHRLEKKLVKHMILLGHVMNKSNEYRASLRKPKQTQGIPQKTKVLILKIEFRILKFRKDLIEKP